MKDNFSIENLKKLMQNSDSYNELSDDVKASIQKHIQSKNKTVLMFIYYQLLEEKQQNDLNRKKLSEKISQAAEDNFSQLNQDIKEQLF